jgi:hypothetical protein
MYAAATGYFGILTQRAVRQFQSSQGIFTTGYVGALTRAAVANASCGGNPPPAAGVSARSLSPNAGPVGTSVTIYGGGFTQDNTINPACYYSQPQCLIASIATSPGTYNVSVTNASGTSNAIAFTVTSDQPQTSAVRIYSITPSTGPVGTTVSITGFGFASSNTIRFGSGAIYNVPISSSIAIACTTNPSCHGGINQTLQFTVPTSLGAYCVAGAACPMYAMLVTPGTYNVSVTNDNGSSDPVSFAVTGTPLSPPSAPTISGIDAPATLSIGTTGVWTVHAAVPNNGSTTTLHYSVDWGDEAVTGAAMMAPQPSQVQSSATFTHAYSQSGTYTATFTVTDDSGAAATVQSTVTVAPQY